MNKFLLVLSSLASSALLSGCVGMGPNTQQGAVAGGAFGALAGAVIGHNSAGGDALGGAVLGATAGALAGGALGNTVDYQRGTLYDYPSDYSRGPGYAAAEFPAPPPPNPESPGAAPAANALWIPGYWTFDGRAYNWTAGHWEIPPPNARAYVAPHWEHSGGIPVYVPGRWQ